MSTLIRVNVEKLLLSHSLVLVNQVLSLDFLVNPEKLFEHYFGVRIHYFLHLKIVLELEVLRSLRGTVEEYDIQNGVVKPHAHRKGFLTELLWNDGLHALFNLHHE